MKEHAQIWLVDDDVEDQLIMKEYFDELNVGENIIFFSHGKKIIEQLEEISSDTYPNLIVLDLNMPILNGTQTLLRIKDNPKLANIPVIIFSTSENDHEKRKCMNFGAVDYLVKPMGYDEGLEIAKRLAQYL